MNTEHPHEIRRFSDGESIPEGYVELTEDEFRKLEPMTPDERRVWLDENGRRSLLSKLRDDLVDCGDVAVGDRVRYKIDRLDRAQRRKAKQTVPPSAKRRHRTQRRN